MFDLHPDATLVNCSLLAVLLFSTYDNKSKRSFPQTYESNKLGQFLGLLIFISVAYIEFRNLKWWKAIIDLVISGAIISILAFTISNFIERKTLFILSIVCMILSVIFLSINIF